MKKYVCMLLMFCMFLGCFAGCNVAEKDPIDSTEQPTESQSETESVSETETEGVLETVYFAQEDIPGEDLAFSAVYDKNRLPYTTEQNWFQILNSKAAAEELFSDLDGKDALLQAVEQVDFETDCLLAVRPQVSSTDMLTLDEVILQDGRLVFVFHSDTRLGFDADVHSHLFLIKVKKTDLPTGELGCYICSYSPNNPYPADWEGIRLGSAYYPNYCESR